MYYTFSYIFSKLLIFILVVILPLGYMGQNITVITAKMEDKIEFQSYGEFENPIMVTQSFQAINKKSNTYKYVIFLDKNQYYYSWYDPIVDVTITQMGFESVITNN